MKIILTLFAFLGSMAFAKGTPHPANCAKIPSTASACLTICQACAPKFIVGDVGIGTGFYADCAEPILKNGGTHQPKKATQPLPPPPSGETWSQIAQQCTSQGGMPKGL